MDVNWVNLCQGKGQVRVVVSIVMNLWADNFLPCLATGTLARRLMLHEIGTLRCFHGLLEVIWCFV
jgi:hypothetical protein